MPLGRGTLRVEAPDAALGEVVHPRPVEPAADPKEG